METQTLASIIRSEGTQTQGRDNQSIIDLETTRHTATLIYTLSLNLLFPDLDLNVINYNNVRNIAEFSIASARPFVDVWNELTERRKMVGKQSRAA